MPSSRPPVYSPEFRALLTNDTSRTTKALKPLDLTRPPTLPPSVNPSTEEARLFGRLSKRREKNILQRFYKQEVQKVYPPLEVEIPSGQTLEDVGARGGGAQGLKLRDDIEAIIGPIWKPPQLTRRERQAQLNPTPFPQPSSGQHPSRWLRRRYQSLLGRLPLLTFTPGQKGGKGRYAIERSPKALGDIYSTGGRLLPIAATPQIAWFESAADQSTSKKRIK
jgi:hypothetical protein